MRFFSKKNRTEQYVIFDIGSASIGASVVSIGPNIKPSIEYQIRKDISFQKELNYERFTKSMFATLESVAEDITKHTSGHIHLISCTLASPWYISQTNLIGKKEKAMFEITPHLLKTIVENEEKRLATSNETKKFERMKSGMAVIEKNILHVAINGYTSQNPIGKRTKEMKASVHISMIPESLLDLMKETFARHFNRTNVTFHSFPLASVTVLRDIFNETEDFLFIDVTGEVTDVSLIESGVLLETASFPKGKHFVLREVSKKLNTIPEDTRSQLSMLTTGSVEEKVSKRLLEALHVVENKWLHDFQGILFTLGKMRVIPHTVFLAADSEFIQIFRRFIEDEKLGQSTLTQSGFDVIPLDVSAFSAFCNTPPGVAKKDPFLCIEAIFLNKLWHLESSV
jgi:hypothetical protein